MLVLDGVKMGARVSLNGHVLGTVTDQFLRSALLASFTVTAKTPIVTVHEPAHCALSPDMAFIARRSIPHHTAEDVHEICTAFN